MAPVGILIHRYNLILGKLTLIYAVYNWKGGSSI